MGDTVKYYAFGFDARPEGGLHDIIATCDTIDDAKAAIERKAPQSAYWHEYKGHIAIIEDNQFKIVLYYKAIVAGNIYAGKTTHQAWSETSIAPGTILPEIS